MSGQPQSLTVDISRREVLRNLGYGRSGQPEGRVARRLDELWDPAVARVRPTGTWRIVGRDQVASTDMPDPSDLVAVGLVTIGPELEAQADRSQDQGELLDALLLDAIGSAGAETAADALDRRVCIEASARGLHAARRISPGYGRWDVRAQRELLALLPFEELGVRLTEGMMMVPRKSVSFAVRLTEEAPARGAGRRRCAGCDMENCAFRREEERG